MDTGSTTSGAGEDDVGKAEPLGTPDHVLTAMLAATGFATEAGSEEVVKEVESDLDKLLAALLPKAKRSQSTHPCVSPNRAIAPFCSMLRLARQQADLTFESSREAATSEWRSALGTWRMARSEYDFGIAQAEATLRLDVAAAVAAYEKASNDASASREWYLYHTVKLAIADTIQAYKASAASAGATLAGAAGSLIAAYPSYVAAIAAAQGARLADDATADQSFWQNVESALDADERMRNGEGRTAGMPDPVSPGREMRT